MHVYFMKILKRSFLVSGALRLLLNDQSVEVYIARGRCQSVNCGGNNCAVPEACSIAAVTCQPHPRPHRVAPFILSLIMGNLKTDSRENGII